MADEKKWFRVSDEIDDHVHGRRRTAWVFGLPIWWPFPIAEGVGGSGATLLGYPVYGGKATPRWVKPVFHFVKRGSDLKWRLYHRYHPRHRYNIIKTDLPPGYYDIDTLMLHGMMALLCRYVEEESGGAESLGQFTEELYGEAADGTQIEPQVGAIARQADKQGEALAIYRWWKHQRPQDQARCDELRSHLYGNRERVSFVPDEEHPDLLHRMVVKPFEGDEVAMNEEFRRLEAKIEHDEDEMLQRLLKIRRTLWT
jgi:hypothetical protein